VTEPRKSQRAVAGPVVSEQSPHADAEALVVSQSSLEESGSAGAVFPGQDLSKGDARVVVDGDVDILPARPRVRRLISPWMRAPTALKRPSF